MPTKDYRVTVTFDYSVTYDESDENVVDDDYLHDAIVDNFDTVDLEFTSEHPIWDEDGNETEETFTISVNCDNVRDLDVKEMLG